MTHCIQYAKLIFGQINTVLLVIFEDLFKIKIYINEMFKIYNYKHVYIKALFCSV